jgi:FkbM family methyltransferase
LHAWQPTLDFRALDAAMTLQEHPTMSFSKKTVTLGGRALTITGSDADPYFRSIEAFAAQLAPLQRFVEANVGEGLLLDVGANIGLTSLALSVAAPRSRVIAFEPSPANIALFESNTRGHDRIELVRVALADVEGSVDFLVPPAGANCHVATAEYEYATSSEFRPMKVPVTTLDHYFSLPEAEDGHARPGDHVALIKIDVEGFEPNVLAGAKRMIARWRPPIWMEFNSVTLNVAQGYSPMAFARALFECFDVMRVGADGALQPIAGAGTLVHDNITLRGSIEDIVLLPRADVEIPDVESMTLPRSVAAELRRLRPARGGADSAPVLER